MGLLSRVDTQSTRLQHHKALVIGGSGGVGRAVSYALASQGASIICHGGHNQDKLDRVVSYIQQHSGKARGLLAPLERASDILPHLDRLGEVDILVVAMGPIAYRSLATTDHSTWQQMVDLNLVLPGLLVSRYLPAMVDAGWGRIVLFGGPHGDTLRGFQTIAAYGAAKTGLSSLCKSASQQTQGQNVTVNMIAPGYVDTEYLSPVQRKNLSAKTPRGALIPPERVARLVNQLILAEEPDMNGAVITLDQGLA